MSLPIQPANSAGVAGFSASILSADRGSVGSLNRGGMVLCRVICERHVPKLVGNSVSVSGSPAILRHESSTTKIPHHLLGILTESNFSVCLEIPEYHVGVCI
jgi:hypothetical protein